MDEKKLPARIVASGEIAEYGESRYILWEPGAAAGLNEDSLYVGMDVALVPMCDLERLEDYSRWN